MEGEARLGTAVAFRRAAPPRGAAKGADPFPAWPGRTTGGQTPRCADGGASSARGCSDRRRWPHRVCAPRGGTAPNAPAVDLRCGNRRGPCNGLPDGWQHRCLRRNGGNDRNLLVALGLGGVHDRARSRAAFDGCSADCESTTHSSFSLFGCPDGLF